MRVAGWKAWYTRGRVYRSSITEWGDIPKVGLLVVTVFYIERNSDGKPYKDLLSGNARYFQATGSSKEKFIKPSSWEEDELIVTYGTKSEWVKEGVWDDDTTMRRITQEALDTIDWR